MHYPTEYFCGLLRNAPLGTYPPHVLESEARRTRIRFLPFDINRSWVKTSVEGGAIRHGLDYVKGTGDEVAEAIVQLRGTAPFRSLADFIERTRLNRRQAESLILAGAFDAFGERRQLLWDLAEAFDIARRPSGLPLVVDDEQAALAPFSDEQRLALTFAATGVTAGPHLTLTRRDAFIKAGCASLPQLRKMRVGAKVNVGGLIADGVRRPPTAKGMAFIRLEREEGIVDVIIPEPVFVACCEALASAFVVVEGTMQAQGVTVSVVAKKAVGLSQNQYKCL